MHAARCDGAVTQAGNQLVCLGLELGGRLVFGQLLADVLGHGLQRQLLRLAVLLDAQYHGGFRVELDGGAVGTFVQHFFGERSLYHRTVGGDAFATLAAEGCGGVHLEVQVLGRLSQVGGLVGSILQLLAGVDVTLLDQRDLQVAGQFVLQAGEAWHFWRLHAQQLDQVVAELGAYRGRYLAILQLVQRVFKGRVVHARAGEAEVTTVVGRAWVLRELLGQCGKVFTLGQTLLNLFSTGLGLGVGDFIVDLDEDVRGMALFREVGNFFLVLGLELFVGHVDLVEERRLLQLDVVDHHLVRRHELLGVLVVVRLDLFVADLDRGRVGLEGQGSEVAGLLLQAGESIHLLVGDEAAAGQAGAQLANEHFLGKHVTELHAAVAHLADDLVETVSTELAVHLEFRRLQDHLIQRGFGEGELGIFGALQQQLAADQALEGLFTQQFVIQQRRVEILAQLLHQLTALHVSGLAELVLADGLAVHLGGVLAMGGGLENGFKAGQRHQHDD